MAQALINIWALKHYRALTEETVLAVLDELKAQISGGGSRVFNSLSDAYALASRFRDVIYRYRFFKTKPLRILWAIVDRCGEAYYYRDPQRLYISKEVVEQWIYSFGIPVEKTQNYLRPMLNHRILVSSDDPQYMYKVGDEFFQFVGHAAARYLMPTDPRYSRGMGAVISGLMSVYVMATSVKLRRSVGEKPLIPWFVKLPMIYTLTGLEPNTMKIRDVLEIARINYVDNYFVKGLGAPVEWWRSVRTEAFDFMLSNDVIEQAVQNGYKLYNLWVRIHEEGVRRYVERVRKRFRGP